MDNRTNIHKKGTEHNRIVPHSDVFLNDGPQLRWQAPMPAAELKILYSCVIYIVKHRTCICGDISINKPSTLLVIQNNDTFMYRI